MTSSSSLRTTYGVPSAGCDDHGDTIVSLFELTALMMPTWVPATIDRPTRDCGKALSPLRPASCTKSLP